MSYTRAQQDADLAAAYLEWPDFLILNGAQHPCIFDEFDDVEMEHEGGAGVLVSNLRVRIPTANVPALKGGDPIAILKSGEAVPVSYTVLERRQIDDGMETVLWLREPGEES